MAGWWRKLEKRFKGGVVFSVIWLVAAFTYAWVLYGWRNFWSLTPNEMGDFFAGTSAPLAFLWLVLGYMQQGEELQKTQKEVERQALFMGRSAFMDFMKLMHADTQFSVLRMLEKASKNLIDHQRSSIKKSRTAYLDGDDKDAPVRRAIKLLSEDFDMMKFALERDDKDFHLVKKIVGNIRKLFEEASLADGKDSQAMRRYVEQSMYGELFNGLCLILGENPEFKTRKAIESPSDLAV